MNGQQIPMSQPGQLNGGLVGGFYLGAQAHPNERFGPELAFKRLLPTVLN